jgi:CRISPR/Cas system-associated exonuclease Cas4 (RecB family)
MQKVTKKIFLNALTCPLMGWLIRQGTLTNTILTLGEQFLIEQGIEIGKHARQLYPDGLLINEKNTLSAARKTQYLMSDAGVSTIFEGTFVDDHLTVKADILRREKDGWHMIEVKSGLNDRELFIDDMAYTAAVIGRNGIPLSRISLYLLSRNFRLGMQTEKLFTRKNHTKSVLRRVRAINPLLNEIERITARQARPTPDLKPECRRCEFFRKCTGKGIVHHIFELPHLSQKKFEELKDKGITCIEEIPDTLHLTSKQMRVRNCVKENKVYIGSNLKRDLHAIEWPAYYLDFEVVSTAIPLYPGPGPYTQVPTQYHIHCCSKAGRITGNAQYLAEPERDCKRELAEHLIKDLRGRGSIITYSNFEKNIIRALGNAFPDLTTELHNLSERIVDLEKIISRYFYHPVFRGSTSIKRTLPVLVPDLSYEDMEIADGYSAMAAFAYLARGRYKKKKEVIAMKRTLLEYCRLDTLAMVKMHEYLANVNDKKL